MFDYIISQVGIVKTVLLFAATIGMIAFAQYTSFKQTRAHADYDWRGQPIRTFLKFASRQEITYMKKVPWMIAIIFGMTTAAVFL